MGFFFSSLATRRLAQRLRVQRSHSGSAAGREGRAVARDDYTPVAFWSNPPKPAGSCGFRIGKGGRLAYGGPGTGKGNRVRHLTPETSPVRGPRAGLPAGPPRPRARSADDGGGCGQGRLRQQGRLLPVQDLELAPRHPRAESRLRQAPPRRYRGAAGEEGSRPRRKRRPSRRRVPRRGREPDLHGEARLQGAGVRDGEKGGSLRAVGLGPRWT